MAIELDTDVPLHTYRRRAVQYAYARSKLGGLPRQLLAAHGAWLWVCAPNGIPYSVPAADFDMLNAADLETDEANRKWLADVLKTERAL